DGDRAVITGFLPYKKAPVRTVAAFNDDEEPETSGDKAAQKEPKKEPVAAGAKASKKPSFDDDDE
ncbi:MAG TPA: hypothetical protein VFU47_12425, partial [Armatimonadota bacterium]|nr:hypothetical protein [Armatimonadota bacterium]